MKVPRFSASAVPQNGCSSLALASISPGLRVKNAATSSNSL